MPDPPKPESFSDTSVDPAIRGVLHRPETPNCDALIYTHGAGGNMEGPLQIAVASAFAVHGFTVLRCNLPYRQRKSFGPPGPADAAKDRAGLKNAIEAMRKLVSGRIFVGGHSYGSRQSSILVAEEPELVSGLLLTSYPLHPPGKPLQLRIEHLHKIKVPVLFVEGTRDSFGTVDEITSAMRLIPAKADMLVIENAGHDLNAKGKTKADDIAQKILDRFLHLFG